MVAVIGGVRFQISLGGSAVVFMCRSLGGREAEDGVISGLLKAVHNICRIGTWPVLFTCFLSGEHMDFVD